jgi:hypothetical protein
MAKKIKELVITERRDAGRRVDGHLNILQTRMKFRLLVHQNTKHNLKREYHGCTAEGWGRMGSRGDRHLG